MGKPSNQSKHQGDIWGEINEGNEVKLDASFPESLPGAFRELKNTQAQPMSGALGSRLQA